ncbi:uncharacterized protein [Onthophagus taurus]|uniref:uncharacterized protein n=1 Tax=Onthophagus taurus TaxID=166361 RepID=UPI0039BEB29F
MAALEKEDFIKGLSGLIAKVVADQLDTLKREFDGKISDFRRDLSNIHEKCDNIEKQISKQISGEIQVLKRRCDEIDKSGSDKIDRLEQYGRRNNLRLFGVKETPEENTDLVVLNIFKSYLGEELDISAIQRSHRIGKIKEKYNRAIIIKFSSYRVRSKIYSLKSQLKGTRVVIKEDLTRARADMVKELVDDYGKGRVWTMDGIIYAKNDKGTIDRFG